MAQITDPTKLSPSRFVATTTQLAKQMDLACRSAMELFRPYLDAIGSEEYDLRRFEAAAFNQVPALIGCGIDLSNKVVLEIGCGRGLKALALTLSCKRYIGVDLDPQEIERAHQRIRDLGIANATFLVANATEILSQPRVFGIDCEIDILFLHSVVEHLTQDERDAAFQMIMAVRSRGGIVIFAETQNRLYPFDHHSTGLHFFDALPDEVALKYIDRSTWEAPKKLARSLKQIDRTSAITSLYRLGRGLSYHDFEIAMGVDTNTINIAADGFHPLLLNFQPINRAELQLADYFSANRLNVHRLFSRSWLDLILAPPELGSVNPVARWIEPELTGTARVERRREYWSLDTFLLGDHGSSLIFTKNELRDCRKLTFILHKGNEDAVIDVRINQVLREQISVAELVASRPSTWHDNFAVACKSLPDDPNELESVEIRLGQNSGVLLFHGAICETSTCL